MLKKQLKNYMFDVQTDERFSNVKGIGSLAQTMVDCKKHMTYPLVYLLIKLILPVATF
ncbi:hypothetical protein ZOSMA_81G00170 [Zostera marina]|uniref:Uncharacterized protein n=1 Tax=Zostera marina TaxID=29655 RepID=A0A0K9NP98_ZOSMR|nr:hypothetical protein ZOSMA_81G00170 [Zostera marina]